MINELQNTNSNSEVDAMQAFEKMRSIAFKKGYLLDKEIEAEIVATRQKKREANKSIQDDLCKGSGDLR